MTLNRSSKRHKPRQNNASFKRKKQKRPIIGVCGATGKLQFASKAKAMKELRRYQAGRSARSVYRCPSCPYWHLTSQRQGRPIDDESTDD